MGHSDQETYQSSLMRFESPSSAELLYGLGKLASRYGEHIEIGDMVIESGLENDQ